MNEEQTPAAPRSFPLNGVILIAWLVIYLLAMWHSGWPWKGAGFWDFGAPGQATLTAFGGVIPSSIQAGEWQRVLLSAWVHRSLVGLLLLLWFWSSTGRQLGALVGRARTWLVFFVGGAAGAITHTLAHPESTRLGGAGPFDAIVAGLGALLAWGMGNNGKQATAIVKSVAVSIVIIALLTWWFTEEYGDRPEVHALLGREAMLGGFFSGIVLMLLFGPRRSGAAAGSAVRAVAVIAALATVAAAVVQGTQAASAVNKESVARFLRALRATEDIAYNLASDPDWATQEKRHRLSRRLTELENDDLVQEVEGGDLLRAYLGEVRAWTMPVERQDIVVPACKRAFDAWFVHEEKLRKRYGIEPRMRTHHYWDSL